MDDRWSDFEKNMQATLNLIKNHSLGDGDLATKTEDGCVLLDIAGRRYLSGSFTLEELKEAFEKATVKE